MTEIPAGEPSIRLISGSCTTGWLDWVWGELWLTPDALVRVSRGLLETHAAATRRYERGGGSTVEPMPSPDEETLRARFVAGGHNRWIEFDQVERARMRRGRLSSRLSVELRDGSRAKLLWLKDDPAYDALHAVLSERLGSRLRR